MSQTKKCKYGCGTELLWDNTNGYYANADSGVRHTCPNYQRGGPNPTTTTADTREQIIEPQKITTNGKEDILRQINENLVKIISLLEEQAK